MTPFIIGILAGTLTTFSFLPQLIKIIRTKHAQDLSLVTFTTFFLGNLLWLIYGIMIREIPVVAANAVSLVLCFLIVILKIRYR